MRALFVDTGVMVAYVDVLTLCPAHNTYAKHRSCVHAQNMEDVNIVIRGSCHQGSWVMQACILGVLPSRQLGYAGMHLCAYTTLYQDMLVCAHFGIRGMWSKHS